MAKKRRASRSSEGAVQVRVAAAADNSRDGVFVFEFVSCL